MKNSSLEFTEGSLCKNIFVFSIPLMFSNLLQALFNMSDLAVVGHFAGPLSLGAVGSTTQLVMFITGILIGLASGINVIAAFYIGAKKEKDLAETVHTGAEICLIAGTAMLVLGFCFAEKILVLMGTKPELIEGATLYLRIYMLGMPAVALYNFGNSILSAAGDTRRPLIFLTAAGILNIALNLFFVIVFRMDVAGVAFASIISQYLSAALILRSLTHEKNGTRLRLRTLKINRHKAAKILKVGLPAGIQNAIFAFANIFIQVGVNSFDAVMVAGNSAAANADPLVYDVMAAFYMGCAGFIGQNYGAAKPGRVAKTYFVALGYSFIFGLVLGLGIHAAGRPFLAIFTSDPAVIEAGLQRISIMSLSYCVSAFMDNTIAASRGLGKTFVPSIIVILGSCVFRIIWIYTVFAWFKTIHSLYLLYVFSWGITALAEIIYFVRIFRKAAAEMKKHGIQEAITE